jgi:asparagine synthase (glutamine-hydrolysing)
MRDSLEHHGPDDKGIFMKKILDLVTGLSILDISSSGHQPFSPKMVAM